MTNHEEAHGLVSRMNVVLYGFDTSQLPPKERASAEQVADRRRELEEQLHKHEESINEVESKSNEETLRLRLAGLYQAKIDKVTCGTPLKHQTNVQLQEVVEILKAENSLNKDLEVK